MTSIDAMTMLVLIIPWILFGFALNAYRDVRAQLKRLRTDIDAEIRINDILKLIREDPEFTARQYVKASNIAWRRP